MKESRFSKSLMRAVRALARSVHSASWLLDVPLAALAWLAAYWLRFNFDVPADERAQALFTLPAALGCMAVGLLAARVPRLSWRFVSLADLRRLAAGVALGTLLQTALIMGLRVDDFPRSVLLISFVLTLLALLLARGAWRSAAEGLHAAPLHAKPLLIAGELGDADQALRALRGAEDWHAVGIVTPDEADTGSSVQGVRVLGSVARVADIAVALEVGAGVHSALAPLLLARAQRVECSALDAATLPVIEQRHAAMLAPEDAARISTSVQDVRALRGRWDCIVMKSVLGGLFRMGDADGVSHMHALIAHLLRENLAPGGWLISLDNWRTALEPLFSRFGARRNGWRFFAAGDFPPAQVVCGFGALGAFSAATRLGAVGHAVDDALYAADCALSPLVRQHAVLGHAWRV